MNIASRTPEGRPGRCPVCGKALRIEPSGLTGDAPCPHCGHLLWFVPRVGRSPHRARLRLLGLLPAVLKSLLALALLSALLASLRFWTGTVWRALVLVAIACLVLGKAYSKTGFWLGYGMVRLKRFWYWE